MLGQGFHTGKPDYVTEQAGLRKEARITQFKHMNAMGCKYDKEGLRIGKLVYTTKQIRLKRGAQDVQQSGCSDERASMMLTRARVNGRTEYMPAARSRYETARSAEMTGWITVALMILKKSVVAYSAPSTFVSPAWVVLQSVTISLSQQVIWARQSDSPA